MRSTNFSNLFLE